MDIENKIVWIWPFFLAPSFLLFFDNLQCLHCRCDSFCYMVRINCSCYRDNFYCYCENCRWNWKLSQQHLKLTIYLVKPVGICPQSDFYFGVNLQGGKTTGAKCSWGPNCWLAKIAFVPITLFYLHMYVFWGMASIMDLKEWIHFCLKIFNESLCVLVVSWTCPLTFYVFTYLLLLSVCFLLI